MATTHPSSLIRSLPPAPNVNVSGVKGNISDEQKQLGINAFAFFVSTSEKSYGAEVGQRFEMVEMNLRKREGEALEAQTICEVRVEKDMCNVYGTLHGGCAAYIVDLCSSSALVNLGLATGLDGTGMSQSMNLIWHQPARVGTKLRVISTTVSMNGRIRSARCELWDKTNEILCVSAVHSTINLRAKIKL